MGLLDYLGSDEARPFLGLLSGAAAKPGPRNTAGTLLGVLNEEEQRKLAMKDREQKAAMQALQMQLLGGQIRENDAQTKQREAQMAQQAEAQRLLAQFRQQIPSPEMAASSAALSGGGGPTNANAARIQPPDPNQMLLYKAMQAGAASPMDYVNSLRKDTTPIKLGAGDTLVQPGTYKPLFTAPNKPAEDPSDWRLFKLSGAEQRGMSFDQWDQARRRAGASSQTVTLGTPVPITLPDGSSALVQPANRPGEPPQIMRLPGSNEPLRPPPKEMPAAMAEKFAQNAVTLQKIDKALALTSQNPDSFGVKNYLGDPIMQRVDPKGVEARALVADIAGQKIHDRSGAAVTVGEAARLKPYIPAATDDPKVAAKKLELFRSEYAAMQKALASGASIKQAAGESKEQPRVVRTGKDASGRRVNQLSDGSIVYAD